MRLKFGIQNLKTISGGWFTPTSLKTTINFSLSKHMFEMQVKIKVLHAEELQNAS